MQVVTMKLNESKSLVKLINVIEECGVSFEDIEHILYYCQSLNTYLNNKGLQLLINELEYYITYSFEHDIILFVENNDILRRVLYFCSLV